MRACETERDRDRDREETARLVQFYTLQTLHNGMNPLAIGPTPVRITTYTHTQIHTIMLLGLSLGVAGVSGQGVIVLVVVCRRAGTVDGVLAVLQVAMCIRLRVCIVLAGCVRRRRVCVRGSLRRCLPGRVRVHGRHGPFCYVGVGASLSQRFKAEVVRKGERPLLLEGGRSFS